MKSRAAFAYIGLAIVLLIPYLFYAVLFRGVFGVIWVCLCLAVFGLSLAKYRTSELPKLLIFSLLASLGIAVASLPIKSGWLFGMLLIGGFLVFSLFSLGIHGTAKSQ